MVEDGLESLPGIDPTTADKLIESGYDSYQLIIAASPGELSNKADIGSSTTPNIIDTARDMADVGGFETGSMVLKRRQQIGRLSWQIDETDELLGGGLETQSITEAYGEFGAGKSQITHQLAVNIQLPSEQGGPGGGCIFIDSEDTLRPEHTDDIVRGFEDEALEATLDSREMKSSIDNEKTIKAPVDDFLGKIHVVKVSNSNHQIPLAERVKELIGKHEGTEQPVHPLCVDLLTTHFCAGYIDHDGLAERQQKLNKHLHDLMRIDDLFNISILMTNQIPSNPGPYFDGPTQPIGGNILGHISTFRIYLRKSKGGKCIVRFVDAPNFVDGEAIIRVQDVGLKSK